MSALPAWGMVGILVAAELFEAYWQQADTLRGALEKGWHYYRRSVFLFLMMHPGYWLTLFVSIYYDVLNWPIIAVLTLKTLDIFFKIEMMRQLFGGAGMSHETEAMLATPIPRWYFLAGAMAYPWLIYVALQGGGMLS